MNGRLFDHHIIPINRIIYNTNHTIVFCVLLGVWSDVDGLLLFRKDDRPNEYNVGKNDDEVKNC